MHDSRTVANRFLALAGKRGETLTPMKLLKLVYISHGWMLALANRPLIRDEVQAWQYGPVIPALYSELRGYRDQPIGGYVAQPAGDALDANEESLVGQVFEIYGDKTGPQLSKLTHAAGTPWARVFVPGTFGVQIPNYMIQEHYRHLAETRG